MIQRLGHLVEQVTAAPDDEPMPFVALENLESRTGELLPDMELPLMVPDPTGTTSFREGDVLFGKLRPYLAKSWRADRRGSCSTELIVMRPRRSVDDRWLAYLAQSDLLVEWAIATSEGVKMPRTSWEKLRLLRIDPPTKAEQHAIADYLDDETARIDKVVHVRREVARLHAEHARTAMAEALAGEPRARLATVLSSIEQGWSPSAADATRQDDDAWAVLKLSAVTGGTYSPQFHKVLDEPPGANKKYEVRKGDLLLTRANTPELVGDVAFVRETPQHLLLPDLVYRLSFLRDRTDGSYLSYALRAVEVRGQLSAVARGSSQSMVKLRSEDIRDLRVPLPSLRRQRELAAECDRIAGRSADTQRAMLAQIDLLLERRQALITAAVTGQLEIPGVAA